MSYKGDYTLGANVDFLFTTRNASGVPTALVGGSLSAYVGNSTTQITAGITLTANFDGITGLNHVRVAATGGNGFAVSTDVSLALSAGTVDSVSVVGELVGGFSIQNRNASPAPSAATIAGAVWDEARAGHVTAGTFGQGVASVQGNVTGNVTGSVASVTGNVSGNVVGSVGSVAGAVGSIGSGGITAASFAANAIGTAAVATALDDRIVDAVWNELQSGHTTAGTFGRFLDAQVSALGTPPSAATIADAVWDEARSGHVAAGSFGEGVASVQGSVTGSVGSVSGSVASVSGNVAGSVGSVVGAVGSIGSGGITAASFASNAIGTGAVSTALDARIVDAVWDELRAGHTTAGTFGLFLDAQVSTAGGGGLTATDVENAVWNAARSGHTTAGTFGQGVASVQGNVTGSVASVSGSVASVSGNVAGSVGSVVGAVGSVGTGGIAATSFAADALSAAALSSAAADKVAGATWNSARASYNGAGTFGQGVASVQGNVTGSVSTLGATALTSINAEVAAALATYDPPTKAEMDAAFAALNDLNFADMWTTTTLAESYAADGALMTPAQALWALVQWHMDRGVVGTTATVYQRNGSTPAYTLTLDDATTPTVVHRTG